MPDINIKELLWAVREELEASEQKRLAEKKDALFQIDMLELELNFTVSERAGTEGGIDFKVIKLGSDLEAASEAVQKIKLSLKSTEAPVFPAHSSGFVGSAKPKGTFPMFVPAWGVLGEPGGKT